ncbi:type II toxin-antitoxin system RelE/ParE family toxin [Thiotrichales bacterium 19X7-9]|nr:type II toxin-antitoxin system RelE/ParE family toxin [Thiotrichales bacterium 19X7-9]
MTKHRKPLEWIETSLNDLKSFPKDVQQSIGYALSFAQEGNKHPSAKPLKGNEFKGASTLEIIENYDGNTYRAVYTVKLKDTIFVLHCFQKKSKQGIKTPKSDHTT